MEDNVLSITQIKAVAERLILLGLGYAVASGWLPEDMRGYVAEALLALVTCVFAIYNSRRSKLLDRAAKNVPEAAMIVPKALADATKAPNVISETVFKAVPKD